MNPVAFSLFGIDVAWYGILIASGMFLAILLGTKLAKKTPGLYEDVLFDFSLWALPLGVIGARLYFVIFSWDYFSLNPSKIIAIRDGGLAIHGGIITGVFVAIIFCKVKKISFWKLGDIVAPGLALAQGIGRWGNYINQEAHGGPTDLPWGIMIDGVKVHPTFLYESIIDIGIFLFLYFYLFKNKKYDGQLLFTYGFIYSIGRFFIEGLRTDSLMIGAFRIAQIISLLIAIICIVLAFVKRKKNYKI